jgi:hypothetical protein
MNGEFLGTVGAVPTRQAGRASVQAGRRAPVAIKSVGLGSLAVIAGLSVVAWAPLALVIDAAVG